MDNNVHQQIKITELTPANLVDAPDPCKYCIYWEYPEKCCHGKWSKNELLSFKKAWLDRVVASFGNCGRIAFIDGVAAGYAQYTISEFFPRIVDYPAGPPSSCAAFISCLFVPQERNRRRGVGRQLLTSILIDLRKKEIGAIETFARRGGAENPSGPIEFYLNYDFRIVRDDSDFPLVRLDLSEKLRNKDLEVAT